MPAVLILSSFVAASRVGGGAQAAALERQGITAILAPTVIFGRHPGLGAPGGGPVAVKTLQGVLDGIAAGGGLSGLSAMILGYFASPGQVRVAVQAIGKVRAASPGAAIIVDPIMGDEEKGLYVKETVARAIARDLVPLADIVTPNAWELARLTGRPAGDLAEVLVAVKALGGTALVTSVPMGEDIGALLASRKGEFLARHPKAPNAPKGTGDLFVAAFAEALAEGSSLDEALQHATAQAAALAAGHAVGITLERLDDEPGNGERLSAEAEE